MPPPSRLSAQSRMVVVAGRGEKPSKRRAFCDVRSFLRPRSGVSIRSSGMNSDTILTTTSGRPRVGTFPARAPSPERSALAMSRIHMKSPAAMKRCPAASGEVMARMCSSARSRTSTTQNPRRGMPAGRPCSRRWMICTEPRFPASAPGRTRRPEGWSSRWSDRLAGHEIPSGALGQNLGQPVGVELRSFGSAHTVSSLTRSEPYGGRAAAAAEVMTTRLTPAFVAARSTRSVPSRAGRPAHCGSLSAPPSGDATCST